MCLTKAQASLVQLLQMMMINFEERGLHRIQSRPLLTASFGLLPTQIDEKRKCEAEEELTNQVRAQL